MLYMNGQLKEQLHNRNRLARRLLAAELRLSKHYEKERVTGELTGDQEYRTRILNAVGKARQYAKNCSLQHERLIALLQQGKSPLAICNELHISESTFYAWRIAIIKAFGRALGLPV